MSREEQRKQVAELAYPDVYPSSVAQRYGVAPQDQSEKRKIFISGIEWADENPNDQMIAKYLYENKGYPIDLNGNLPSFDETMKDVELYDKYKKKKLIDKACDFIRKNFKNDYQGKGEPVVRTDYSFVESIIEDLTKAMEE